jgi:hypothetical protein
MPEAIDTEASDDMTSSKRCILLSARQETFTASAKLVKN